MIGRNAAVAEVGKHRHELEGVVAFAAWLGVHAALMATTRAKIEAFMEWAWAYFGGTLDQVILDRPEELQVNWNEDGDESADVAAKQEPSAAKPSAGDGST